jgi:hypothetical protein
MQATFDDGAQKRQTPAGHAGLVPGRAENRAGHLTKPAAIALRNVIVVLLYIGQEQILQKYVGSTILDVYPQAEDWKPGITE